MQNYMPKGYYMNKKKKEEDKYVGLFSGKQLADLEGETELVVSKVSKKEVEKKIKDQKGHGLTYTSPFSFSDY